MTGKFSPDEKHRCLTREVQMRKRVYPGLVRKGKMTQEEADKEIAMMREIAADLYDLTLFSGERA